MKSRGKKTLLGSLAVSIFLESCTQGYYLPYDIEEINENISRSTSESSNTLLPIDLVFTADQCEYLFFLQELAQDIVRNNDVAKEFIDNPKAYISKKGYTEENINIDSNLTEIILALADIDICNAVESGDISDFLDLLKNKNLVKEYDIKDIEQLNEEDFQKLMDAAMKGRTSNYTLQTFSYLIFVIAVVVGVAAVVWVAAVEHAAAANAVVAATVVAWKVGVVGKSPYNHTTSLSSSNTLKIWSIKSQDPASTVLVVDSIILRNIESMIKYFKTHYPNRYSEEEYERLKNAIIANIQQQPYED